MIRPAGVPLWCALVAALAAQSGVSNPASAALATHSFTNHSNGTHPGAIGAGGATIVVNLSAIAGATVRRATLDPGVAFDYIDLSMNSLSRTSLSLSAGGAALSPLAPRYEKLDATEAVRQALASGGTLTLTVIDEGPGLGGRLSLDVLCDVALPAAIAPVTGAAARFEDGDAMITFDEPFPIFTADSASCSDFYNVMQTLDDVQKTRYRIYRSFAPLTSEAALAGAVLVDEIEPLSGWNPRLPGPGGQCYPTYGGGTVHTLPVGDGVHAAGGTGIYVDRFRGAAPDTAYFFVSRTLDGAEDFSVLQQGMNASGPVARTSGGGMVLLDKVEHATEFNYGASSGQYFYVKWDAPPASNLPSSPNEYLVAVPSAAFAIPNPGVDLALHCWGGNLTGGYGWWYSFEQGHLLVASNQFPFQDWWTGYHENLGTLRGCDHGTVKPYTMHRLLAFIRDFVVPEYGADTNRIILSGGSMGGAGTSLAGLRNGQVFSNLISWVGVHVPRETPTFASSFERAWGPMEWNAPFSNVEFAERFGGQVIEPGDTYGVWDYYDNNQWLRANPGIQTPWLTYSNGVNDSAIGWPQAVSHTEAMMDTWRPFNFQWGMEEHSQRVALLDPYGYDKTQMSRLVFSLDQSFPLFRNASADGDFNADPQGKINAYASWDTGEVTDESERWEITLFIPDAPSGGSYGEVFPDSLTTDVSPARLRNLSVLPGASYDWSWSAAGSGAVVATGSTVADALGRVAVPGLVIKKNEPRRLLIVPAAPASVHPGDSAGHAGLSLELIGPNPVGSATPIRYTLPQAARAHLRVLDASGRVVRVLVDERETPGAHSARWDGLDATGRPAASGVYFVRLDAGALSTARKVTMMR